MYVLIHPFYILHIFTIVCFLYLSPIHSRARTRTHTRTHTHTHTHTHRFLVWDVGAITTCLAMALCCGWPVSPRLQSTRLTTTPRSMIKADFLAMAGATCWQTPFLYVCVCVCVCMRERGIYGFMMHYTVCPFGPRSHVRMLCLTRARTCILSCFLYCLAGQSQRRDHGDSVCNSAQWQPPLARHRAVPH